MRRTRTATVRVTYEIVRILESMRPSRVLTRRLRGTVSFMAEPFIRCCRLFGCAGQQGMLKGGGVAIGDFRFWNGAREAVHMATGKNGLSTLTRTPETGGAGHAAINSKPSGWRVIIPGVNWWPRSGP
jgi:hypothetical protein